MKKVTWDIQDSAMVLALIHQPSEETSASYSGVGATSPLYLAVDTYSAFSWICSQRLYRRALDSSHLTGTVQRYESYGVRKKWKTNHCPPTTFCRLLRCRRRVETSSWWSHDSCDAKKKKRCFRRTLSRKTITQLTTAWHNIHSASNTNIVLENYSHLKRAFSGFVIYITNLCTALIFSHIFEFSHRYRCSCGTNSGEDSKT